MNKKISNSSDRLKEMMSYMSLKQSDIVTRTGITKSALSNYLHGTREPRQDQISKIADPYGINPAWLMGYDVPMFTSNIYNAITAQENEIIKSFRELDEDSQRQAILMLKFLKEQENKNEN